MLDSLDLVIDTIVAREVLDSRGTPTVDAEVMLEGGNSSRGSDSTASEYFIRARCLGARHGRVV